MLRMQHPQSIHIKKYTPMRGKEDRSTPVRGKQDTPMRGTSAPPWMLAAGLWRELLAGGGPNVMTAASRDVDVVMDDFDLDNSAFSV